MWCFCCSIKCNPLEHAFGLMKALSSPGMEVSVEAGILHEAFALLGLVTSFNFDRCNMVRGGWCCLALSELSCLLFCDDKSSLTKQKTNEKRSSNKGEAQ